MEDSALVVAFRLQAGGCRYLDSPFYAALMEAALEDVQSGGLVARYLADWQGDPLRGFLPLRLFGAVHERVLSGEADELARFYPSVGGSGDAAAAWPAFLRVIDEAGDSLRPHLERFPQTNEVRRCAGLLGGFLEIAGKTGLPLRLREIGCSAGLNLGWLRYHYVLGPHAWGNPESAVQIEAEWSGAAPRLGDRPQIESRAGCDLDPRAIDDDEAVRVLESFVWGDQPERLEQLRGAVQIARSDPPRVDRARAGEWLPVELAAAADGACTVVFHSSVWLYIPGDEQSALRASIEAHGAAASRERPLAWLRHEDAAVPGRVEIRLTLWPGGEERLLGAGHPHGRRVEWRG